MTNSLFRTIAQVGSWALFGLQAAMAAPSSNVTCWMNSVKQTCKITSAPKDGFKIEFSAGDKPIYTFTPVGPATSSNRKMKDNMGTTWLMTGNRSFTLKEVGGYGNSINVSAP